MKLGIDFGTTRTVVSAAVDGRYSLAAFDEDGAFREHVPGIAALRGGKLLVGWEAGRALADGSAEHAVRSIKRLIGAMAPDDEALPGVSALELATAFLRGLREALEQRSNVELRGPLEAMVAVPANAASRQRWLTLEAFRRAGFQPIGLLNEPTAAAVEYAHLHLDAPSKKPKSPKRYVVVYDLGGGTFDTSAVSLEGRRFDLIASEGLARLGGDDFDELVLEAAGVPATADNLERAREAKETLRSTTRKLRVEFADRDVTIDVADLYARAQPLIEQTLVQTQALFERLRERGIDPDDARQLGGVYVVGGGSAFPAVARALRERFGKKLQLAPQAFAATAVGLAIAADPDAHVMVREAPTRNFGVWREADHGYDKVFDPLLGPWLAERASASERAQADDSAGPLTITRRYRPSHTIGHLRFVECGALDRGGQPVQDLVPWADVYFPYDPKLADRRELASLPNERRPDLLENEIAETYTYAGDGTISVRIENVSRGYARTYDLGALR